MRGGRKRKVSLEWKKVRSSYGVLGHGGSLTTGKELAALRDGVLDLLLEEGKLG